MFKTLLFLYFFYAFELVFLVQQPRQCFIYTLCDSLYSWSELCCRICICMYIVSSLVRIFYSFFPFLTKLSFERILATITGLHVVPSFSVYFASYLYFHFLFYGEIKELRDFLIFNTRWYSVAWPTASGKCLHAKNIQSRSFITIYCRCIITYTRIHNII